MKFKLYESLNDLPSGLRFPQGAAVDTETLGLNPLRDRLCVCQVADGQGNVWLVQFNGLDYSAPNLKALLQDATTPKLFHFARFDLAALYQYLGVMAQTIYCTKIASRLSRTYTDKHGLKSIVFELLGVELDKTEQTTDWASSILTDAQKHYAASDVLYLHALRKILDEKLTERGRLDHAHACFDFLPTRAKLDLLGWADDDIFAHR